MANVRIAVGGNCAQCPVKLLGARSDQDNLADGKTGTFGDRQKLDRRCCALVLKTNIGRLVLLFLKGSFTLLLANQLALLLTNELVIRNRRRACCPGAYTYSQQRSCR